MTDLSGIFYEDAEHNGTGTEVRNKGEGQERGTRVPSIPLFQLSLRPYSYLI